MIDLIGIAKKVVSANSYLSIDNVIKDYPKGITLNGLAERISRDGKVFYTFTFVENPAAYISASAGDLAKLVTSWLKDGSVKEVDEALKHDNIKIKIEKIKLRNGNPYTKVTALEVVHDRLLVDEDGVAYNAENVTIDENGKVYSTETGEVFLQNVSAWEEPPF